MSARTWRSVARGTQKKLTGAAGRRGRTRSLDVDPALSNRMTAKPESFADLINGSIKRRLPPSAYTRTNQPVCAGVSEGVIGPICGSSVQERETGMWRPGSETEGTRVRPVKELQAARQRRSQGGQLFKTNAGQEAALPAMAALETVRTPQAAYVAATPASADIAALGGSGTQSGR